MKRRFSEIKKCQLFSVDGVVGRVVDVLIQDDSWDVRYLVVALDNTVPTRRVLISPAAVEGEDLDRRYIATTLNSQQIIDSPEVDWDQPISRQYESALVDYYGWPIYWLGRAVQISPQKMQDWASGDPGQSVCEEGANLRSANELCGYSIKASSGRAGYMRDLIIEMHTWSVEFATAEPNNWLPSNSCMFATRHIDRVDWSNRELTVDLTREVLTPDKPDAVHRAMGARRIAVRPSHTI